MAAHRARWREDDLADVRADQLVFVDETWCSTNMTRLRGRAPVGQRLDAKVPHGHWKTSTLVAAMDLRGIRCSNMWDGAINQLCFEAFVCTTLVPQLRPGDVVVMDNLSSHKSARVRQMIEDAGARLIYLPPYSPDLNPIELAFSKLKQAMRSLAARSVEALWNAMNDLLATITPSDAAAYFKHRGYTLDPL